jgi:hypothetical protein
MYAPKFLPWTRILKFSKRDIALISDMDKSYHKTTIVLLFEEILVTILYYTAKMISYKSHEYIIIFYFYPVNRECDVNNSC